MLLQSAEEGMRGAAHADATPKPAAWEEENLKRKGPFDPPDPAEAAARAGVAVRAVWQWHSPIEVKQRIDKPLCSSRRGRKNSCIPGGLSGFRVQILLYEH